MQHKASDTAADSFATHQLQPLPQPLPGRARSAEAKRRVREVLIAAGRELISREGSTPVSLRQIARHAQYSPGIVYRYFPDKAALFLAIRDDGLTGFARQAEKIIHSGDDPERILRATAEAAFTFAMEQAALFGMNMLTLFWTTAPTEKDHAPHMRDPSFPGSHIHRLYEHAITAFFRQIGRQPVSPSLAVATFMSAITGAVALPAGSKHGDFPERVLVMRSSIDMLISGWKAAQTSSK